ncbi:MAG: dTMP kinase [Hyphomicrobiaceae bacterium]|nr:dTMP kinase [Hyphomicrobiaceae bacterium]
MTPPAASSGEAPARIGRGTLVTLEGGEGSGKSTQARLLAAAMTRTGREVVLTREPGGTPLAEAIRALVLAERPGSPLTELLLFAAARVEHVTAVIGPALQRGAVVICDRFIDSTRVYQGVVQGVDRDLIITLERSTLAGIRPDLTLMLDLEPSLGLARATTRGSLSRFDAADLAMHEAIRAGFLAIARDEPERCAVIAAGASEDGVAAAIRDAVARRLPELLQGAS